LWRGEKTRKRENPPYTPPFGLLTGEREKREKSNKRFVLRFEVSGPGEAITLTRRARLGKILDLHRWNYGSENGRKPVALFGQKAPLGCSERH